MTVLPESELGRDDVIGCRLVDVVQSTTLDDEDDSGEVSNVDDGMDRVYTFYRLDSGATFSLPFDDAGAFSSEEPARGAVSLNHPQVKPVLGQRIIKVVRRGPDADFYHDSPYLIMENGYAVTDVMVYPSGVGYAGVHVYSPQEIDFSKMVDFFPDDDRTEQQ